MVSSLPVRFHAMMIPRAVPIKKAIIRELPAKNMVQKRPFPIISETGSGK